MRFSEVISPDRDKDVPAHFLPSNYKEVPLSVVSGQQYTVLHGLGRLPRAIFVSMADDYAQVKVFWRDAQHCLVAFNADANVILRVE